MPVYVDPMVNHGKRIGHAGPSWCHMIADTRDELHRMANAIGLKRGWFQKESNFPHYDIGTKGKRDQAIRLGAIACERHAFVEHMRRIRGNGRKTCPGCGYPTADGYYCGECMCENDGV
jgi:hypothetical protein